MPDRIGKWRSVRESNRLVHLMPVDDAMAHFILRCPCSAKLEMYPILEGHGPEQNFGIYVHNAFDHREDNLNRERTTDNAVERGSAGSAFRSIGRSGQTGTAGNGTEG